MSYFSPLLLFRAVCETAVLGTMLDRVYAMYMEYSWWTREGPGVTYFWVPPGTQYTLAPCAETLDDPYYRRVPLPRIQDYCK